MNNTGLVELALVFGAVLGVLIWELLSVRRSQRRDAEQERAGQDDDRPAR